MNNMNTRLIVSHLVKEGDHYDTVTDWQMDLPNVNSVHPNNELIRWINADVLSGILWVSLAKVPDYVFTNGRDSIMVTNYDMRKCGDPDYKLIGGAKQFEHLRKGVMVNS